MKMTPPRVMIGTLILVLGIIFLSALESKAQTVQLMPQLRLQPLSNTGTIQPLAVLYAFQAGTTNFTSTYTDSTGIILNQNPIPADSSGRLPQIWLLNQFYKFVLCVQNDGATCAAGDTLYTVDNVPGFGGGSSGSAASPFTSASANPATAGILRLAAGDAIDWRNQANNANLPLAKDSNDLLTWPNGIKLTEGTAPAGVLAFDVFWADSTAHRLKTSGNGGAAQNLVISGADINTSDQVTATHLASPLPAAQGGTGGTSNVTTINGTGCTIGASCTPVEFVWSTLYSGCSINLTCLITANTYGAAHTLVRLTVSVVNGSAALSGCSTAPVFSVKDETASSILASDTLGNGVGYVDSGALSVAMTGGHKFSLSETTAGVGCTQSFTISVSANIQ